MSIFYLDPLNGNDATTATPLGWWSVAFTGGTAPEPAVDEQVTGATSGSTAKITAITLTSGSWAAGTAAGTMYFYGKSAAFVSEQVDCAGGGYIHITADFTNCAWKTIKNGATAARIAPNDTIRIRRNINQPFSIGNARWENCQDGGAVLPTAINISSSTNASPIEITTSTNHGLATADVVFVTTHSTNTTANGAWLVTKISDTKFTLDGSTGVGVGGATGTIRKVNSLAVVMDSALTLIIDQGERTWTAIAGGDVTASLTAIGRKAGYYNPKLQFDSTPQASVGQAFMATGTIPMATIGAYEKITFWIYSSNVVNANSLTLNLCSDTAGATPVDVFAIPARAYAGWTQHCLTRNGGGYLGNGGTSDIKSIALYTGTTKPPNSVEIRLDNIQACNGLSLCSIISKSNSTQDNSEGWYGIQSIQNKVILLEGGNNQVFPQHSSMLGYSTSGTALETVETFGWNIDFLVEAFTDGEVMDSGTQDNPITFSGGWNPVTNEQDSETWFDALSTQSSSNTVFSSSGRSFIVFDRLCGLRATNLFRTGTGVGGEIKNTMAVNCNSHISLQSTHRLVVENVQTMNCDNGMNTQLADFLYMKSITVRNCGTGISLNQITGAQIDQATIINCTTVLGHGSYCNKTRINEIIAKDCQTLSTLGAIGDLEVIKYKDTNCGNSVAYTDYHGSFLRIGKMESTGYPITYSDGAQWEMQAATVGVGNEWKVSILSTERSIHYPVMFPIRKLLCNSNAQVTVTVKVSKSTSTDISARLVCKGGQIDGVGADVYEEAPNDTNYNTLQIQFTPTEIGVVEIYLMVYSNTGNVTSHVIVDESTAIQE